MFCFCVTYFPTDYRLLKCIPALQNQRLKQHSKEKQIVADKKKKVFYYDLMCKSFPKVHPNKMFYKKNRIYVILMTVKVYYMPKKSLSLKFIVLEINEQI